MSLSRRLRQEHAIDELVCTAIFKRVVVEPWKARRLIVFSPIDKKSFAQFAYREKGRYLIGVRKGMGKRESALANPGLNSVRENPEQLAVDRGWKVVNKGLGKLVG